MRYTPTLKLSTRLTAFVTMIVIGAMFILFVGSTFSFNRIGKEQVHRYLESVVAMVDRELDAPDFLSEVDRWIPAQLEANSVVEMTLTRSEQVIYRFKNYPRQLDKSRLYQREYLLPSHPEYQIHFTVIPAYLGYSYSFGALSSISLAVVLVLFCLLRGVKWLKRQLKGSELLEERGRMLLAGRVDEYAVGKKEEWPYTASQALDNLIKELKFARQERSRFDTFIRTHTFLDQLTGAANRVLFDSKLESALQESGANGGVLLIQIRDWESVCDDNDQKASEAFLLDVATTISNLVQRYPDVIFARYYDSDFAVLIPNQTRKEITTLANHCLRQLEKISPLSPLEAENWCHIGLTMYAEGERRGHILNEVEAALKSAQLEGVNNWNLYQKQIRRTDSRGSVRWRTLFDQSFRKGNILIFEQPCYLAEKANGSTNLLHNELFARIDDDGVGILKASRFTVAVEQVGYETMMDMAVLRKVFAFLKASRLGEHYSVNLNTQPFRQKGYLRWFRDELLQMPVEVRQQISFDFVEGMLVKHLDHMRPVFRMIAGMGCKVIVGQAGRTITSTHYIKELNVDYLKLHRSLVKKIDQRQENQLFIRSLLGACEGTRTQVIAVGVETGKEWATLLELGVDGGQGRMFQSETQLIPKPVTPMVQIGKRNRWRKKY